MSDDANDVTRRKERPRRPELRFRLVDLLDAALALCAAGALLYLATGGIDFGFVSVRRFSKPFLLLLLTGALRAAIPRRVICSQEHQKPRRETGLLSILLSVTAG